MFLFVLLNANEETVNDYLQRLSRLIAYIIYSRVLLIGSSSLTKFASLIWNKNVNFGSWPFDISEKSIFLFFYEVFPSEDISDEDPSSGEMMPNLLRVHIDENTSIGKPCARSIRFVCPSCRRPRGKESVAKFQIIWPFEATPAFEIKETGGEENAPLGDKLPRKALQNVSRRRRWETTLVCPTCRVKEARCNIVIRRHYPVGCAMSAHATGHRRGRRESFNPRVEVFPSSKRGK